ncbi:MAG: hypothetical protein AVDCRST_MAG10-337 [uncultured Acidimicrobiales bacterium]|uniref:Protein kinase domain-containing protein n=2 Tax=uncultured Acidimicrobiales bacterium TaxID=310071 RepID=A0A6J4H5N4_9ACTN|nr:MAG: hypothetical protein AVDCRST_MAG10-337 [uncultured Acidimicrobiales bacterium]
MAELIRGRYEPLEIVGAGGQSTVLRALDHHRSQLVGLKVRPRGSAEDEGSLLREAQILQGLEPHPLLCRVRENFFAGDRYVLVMDWIEGTTLADLLAATGGAGLPLADVTHYLGQVAEAVDHLHRHRPPVVHGDIKPANLIVSPDGKVVLVDFGISHRALAGEPSDAPAAGTAGYAAPEVAMGHPPTPASDVFSLAATTFALLTGRPPRPGDRPVWTGIDDERARLVEFALRRGLSVDPARRPATARSLVEALQGQLRIPDNLPPGATPFLGRRRELAEVKALLGTARLVTLTGADGIGKSRLAFQVIGDQLSEFPDGGFVVDVAACTEPAFLSPMVLLAVEIVEGNTGAAPPDPATVLISRLERRNVVLLLDGCDAVLPACAGLATSVLAACPHVRILATSRRPLGTACETVYEVPALSAPDPFRLPELDRLGEYDAVRLLVDRARDACPGFDVRVADAPAVAQLCRRFDGIPLALELVAARTCSTPLGALSAELAERFPLLAGGRRSVADQESTLGAVIEWAYQGVPEPDRDLFDRLSVFAGGFDARAAALIVGVPDVDVRLAGLVRPSLIGTAGSRFTLHDTLRRYGARRLAESGDEVAVRARHLEWALRLTDDLAEIEHANLLAALAWAVSQRRTGAVDHLVAVLARLYDRRAHVDGSRRWLRAGCTAG